MPETYEIAPDGTPERLIQRLENANCGELFYCEADREEAVEIAQEEFATALAEAKAQARRDAFEEERRKGLEEAASRFDNLASAARERRDDRAASAAADAAEHARALIADGAAQ
ncbi:hypothetical protein [Methylobacterium flocculans]|uniref:hypothetical protein n=1 Tax=Methylobacterium flocculans TaxID=2984843 RepID=UPI0021F29763|nr:hypothetical protein [Methylobacterium sp. FF17]